MLDLRVCLLEAVKAALELVGAGGQLVGGHLQVVAAMGLACVGVEALEVEASLLALDEHPAQALLCRSALFLAAGELHRFCDLSQTLLAFACCAGCCCAC